ncbi:MAG TPA: glycosyltransferase family 4 protein [Oculatellaceae cyanobacterium]|jgi:glycosyltransferase involved in cell wall biosynthesis
MKVAYITTDDAQNIKNWSGSTFYIGQALRNQLIDIEYIGSLPPLQNFLTRAKGSLYRRLLKQVYQCDRDPLTVKHYAKAVEKCLEEFKNIDCIFSQSTVPIAGLKTEKPIFFWTDATFAGMVDYYPNFKNLCWETLKQGSQLEQMALNQAKFAIYSSDWAAKSAIDNYQVDPAKVKVVSFGANLNKEKTLDEIKQLIAAKPTDVCKLLFMGVDWNQKGGSIALNVAEELNKGGLKTELTIVGCYPPDLEAIPNFVKCKGFISKATQEGREEIEKVFSENHFLILPTRAEAYGLVFCEANSFGLPNIATKTGGVPTIVKDGVNGQLFNLDDSISAYVNYINEIFVNYSEYVELALSSFNEYKTRLNWEVAGKKVKNIILGED